MTLLAYDLLLITLLPVLAVVLAVSVLGGGRLRSTWRGQLTLDMPTPRSDRPLIWVHAASVGETRAVEALMLRLAARWPNHQRLLTSTTDTGQALGRQLGLADHYAYLPFDLPGLPDRLLTRTRPQLVVIAETEVWPNFLAACRRRAVPVVVVNGRLSPRREPSYRRLAGFFTEVLSGVKRFLVQSEADARRFAIVGAGPDRVRVTGDLKVASVLARAEALDPAEVAREFGLTGRRWLVAGSLHPGEEGPVLEAFGRVAATRPDLGLILAPRHIESAGHFEAAAMAAGWVCRRASSAVDSTAFQVLLVDTIGDLARLYVVGEAAFVGGSLIPVGGHSVLEPSALGCPVVVGPHHENFSSDVERLRLAGGAQVVNDVSGLVGALEGWLSVPAVRAEAAEAARKVARSAASGLEVVVDELGVFLS